MALKGWILAGIGGGLAGLAALALAQERPDELRMRNGAVYRGRAVEMNSKTVTFRTDDGIKDYNRSDVSAILLAVGGVEEGTEFPPGFSANSPHKLKRVITFHQITKNRVTDQGKSEPQVAKISANGSRIAFWASGSGLYSVNPDGTDLKLVWENNADHNRVEWDRFELSPDGKAIYWETPPHGAIRRVNADGTNLKTLVNTGAEYEPLRLRQGGKRIFFGSRAGIFSIDTDGNGDLRTVIDTKRAAQIMDLYQGDDSGRTLLSAFDVSEDGTRVVLNLYDMKEKKKQLAAINADGTGFRYLIKTDFEPTQLHIAPDGNQIVYWKYAEKAFTLNWNGSGLRELSIPAWDPNGSGFQHMARFTADGNALAYDGAEGGAGPKILRLDTLEFFEPNNVGRMDYFAEALFWGMFSPSYSADQRRFSTISQYWAGQRPKQLVVGDINPRRAEAIPTLAEIEFPETLSTNPQLPTHSGLIKMRVKPGVGDIQRVWFMLTPNAAKRANSPEQWRADQGWWVLDGNHIAHDDGKDGDAVKGDGIFTGTLTANSGDYKPVPGRYQIRIVAHDDLNAAIVDVDGVDIK